MDHQELLQAERDRRSAMWEAVQRIQQERPLVADVVREIGCYNGARGIWRHKKSTADLTLSGSGVCVGISSRGKYEDEILQETGTPATTQRPNRAHPTKETATQCGQRWSCDYQRDFTRCLCS